MTAGASTSTSASRSATRTGQPPAWLWAAAAAVVGLVLAPLGYIVFVVSSDPAWNLLISARTAELLANTLGLVVAVTVTSTALGVSTAWVVARLELPLRSFWAAAVALPLVIPSYVAALAFVSASGPNGTFAQVTGVSLPRIDGFFGSWLALSLTTYPYVFLVVVVALRRMSPALEEAARSLGRTSSQSFFAVVVGQLRPAIGASGLLVALYTLSDFGAVSLMRFDTFTRAIYAQWAVQIDRRPALTLAVGLIAVAAIVLWGEQRTRGRAQYSLARPSRLPDRIRLSRPATIGVQAALGLLLTLALVVPLFVLVHWLLRGIANGQTIDGVWIAGWRSAIVSLAAAAGAAVASIPIALLVVRYPSRLTRLLERMIWSVYALPHITVAVAILYFSLVVTRPLYQSAVVLIGAYVVLFLPQAMGAVETALRQVHPNIEEAGRSLGSGHFRSLFLLTVPLIGRGLMSGGALVFLTVMKELPATLLLRPTGFDTLALAIWQQANEGFYARASAGALVLLCVSAVPMFFIATRTLRS